VPCDHQPLYLARPLVDAQRIIDRALQIHGGNGVVKGAVVERLYRDVRALRIYEGASEVQRLVIARHLLQREAKSP
jgi:acyl-CoA dehydrogenase